MKLDFEENEGKQEIKIAELLSKLKEKDGIIDSQASVKRDLEDDIEALKKRIAILTRKNSELDTNLQELTNINTALEKIENYKAEIEIALQENIKTLKNNEEIQKKLTDIPKEINGIVNENKKKIDDHTDILISKLEKRITNKIFKNEFITCLFFVTFIVVLGFNIIKLNSLADKISENNKKLNHLDFLFRGEKKFWYDKENHQIFINTDKNLKEYLENKDKKK